MKKKAIWIVITALIVVMGIVFAYSFGKDKEGFTDDELAEIVVGYWQKDIQTPTQNQDRMHLTGNGEFYLQFSTVEEDHVLAETGTYKILDGKIEFTTLKRLKQINSVFVGESAYITGDNLKEYDYEFSTVNEISECSVKGFNYHISESGGETETLGIGIKVDNIEWYPVDFEPAFLSELRSHSDGIWSFRYGFEMWTAPNDFDVNFYRYGDDYLSFVSSIEKSGNKYIINGYYCKYASFTKEQIMNGDTGYYEPEQSLAYFNDKDGMYYIIHYGGSPSLAHVVVGDVPFKFEVDKTFKISGNMETDSDKSVPISEYTLEKRSKPAKNETIANQSNIFYIQKEPFEMFEQNTCF